MQLTKLVLYDIIIKTSIGDNVMKFTIPNYLIKDTLI